MTAESSSVQTRTMRTAHHIYWYLILSK